MKSSKYIIGALASLLIISMCKKDHNELTKEMLSGKWQVTGSTVYQSFEFNKSGNYIVIMNTSGKGEEVVFGDYEINNETVNLYDFGRLEDVKIEGDKLNAVVIDDAKPGQQEEIASTKTSEYENTTRTDLLCRTWRIISWNDQTTNPYDADEILFSQAGTYLVTYSEGLTGLSTWQWKDSEETTLCYSWEGNPTCDGTNEVEITDLTSTTCSIIEDGNVFKLEPSNSSKTSIIIPQKNLVKSRNFLGASKGE